MDSAWGIIAQTGAGFGSAGHTCRPNSARNSGAGSGAITRRPTRRPSRGSESHICGLPCSLVRVTEFTVRPARASDEVPLGTYGAALMRQHHDADPRRFLIVDHPEAGYGRFLVSMLADPDCFVWVAESSSEVVGYVFAEIGDTSWKDLRGPGGFIHDIYVGERARGQGMGAELLRAALSWIASKGMTQTVLFSKTGNASAQHLFAKMGFRQTMVEMTRDTDG